MNLLIRLIITLFKFRVDKNFKINQVITQNFYVLPNDLDLHGHMNNGRYLTIMDLGRLALMKQSGLLKIVKQQKYLPVVGSTTITYRKELKVFDKFTLKTQITHMDDKWMYILHEMWRGEQKVASAILKGLFIKNGKSVPTQELLDKMGMQWPANQQKPAYLDNFDITADEVFKDNINA